VIWIIRKTGRMVFENKLAGTSEFSLDATIYVSIAG
jgi:hypothetical protein